MRTKRKGTTKYIRRLKVYGIQFAKKKMSFHLPYRDYNLLPFGPDMRGPDFVIQARRRSPAESTDDSGRISSDSSNGTPTRNAAFSADMEWDSGVDESPTDHTSNNNIAPPPLSIPYLDQSTGIFAIRLRSLVASVDFFFQLAKREIKNFKDLLDDMDRKLKPQIYALDEDVSEVMDQIKANVDVCRITDQSLTSLLIYSEFLRQVRQMLETLMTKVLDQLERHLTRLERGATGLPQHHSAVQLILMDLTKSAQKLELNVREEGKRQCQYSPITTSNASRSGNQSLSTYGTQWTSISKIS